MGFLDSHKRESAFITVLLVISTILLFASLGAPVWSDHQKGFNLDMYWVKYKISTSFGSIELALDNCKDQKGSGFTFKECDFAAASKATLSLLTLASIVAAASAVLSILTLITHKLERLSILKLVGAVVAASLTFIGLITYYASFKKNVSDRFAGSQDGETYGPVGWAIALTAGILLVITVVICLVSGRRHGYTKL